MNLRKAGHHPHYRPYTDPKVKSSPKCHAHFHRPSSSVDPGPIILHYLISSLILADGAGQNSWSVTRAHNYQKSLSPSHPSDWAKQSLPQEALPIPPAHEVKVTYGIFSKHSVPFLFSTHHCHNCTPNVGLYCCLSCLQTVSSRSVVCCCSGRYFNRPAFLTVLRSPIFNELNWICEINHA